MFVESREMSWFEKLFIVAQKLQAGKFPLVTPGNPSPLDLHRAIERGGQRCRQNLMRVCFERWSVRSMPWEGKKAFGSSNRRGWLQTRWSEDIKILLSSQGVEKQDFEGLLWGHRASDIHPSFVLGLRPMPRPIITCKKHNGDHGNPKNYAEDNSVLG